MFSRIRKYLQNENIEVEYKLKLTSEEIKSFLVKKQIDWASKCEIEQSVNIIYKTGMDSSIRRIIFTKQNKATDFYKKKVLLKIPINKGRIFLSISEELPLKGINSTKPELFRIKNRLSVNLKRYRVDITQVKTILNADFENNKQIVLNERTKLFQHINGISDPKILYNKFIGTCDDSYKLEMEIEFLNTPDINASDLEFDNILLDIPELNEVISYNVILRELEYLSNIKLGQLSLKKLLSKATSITQISYRKIYPPIDYYVTIKADGLRCILYVSDISYVLSSSGSRTLAQYSSDKKSIIDGEILYTNDPKKEQVVFLFDILMYEDESCIDKSFKDRIILLNKFYNNFKPSETVKGIKIKIFLKKYHFITEDLRGSFKNVIEEPFNYPADGYILVEPNKGYYDTKNYKIKEHNTIDFMAIDLPKILEKDKKYTPKQGYKIMLLFSGITRIDLEGLGIQPLSGYTKIFSNISSSSYVPIQFSPADLPNAYIWYVPNKLHSTFKEYMNIAKRYLKSELIFVELEAIFNKGKFVEWKYYGLREDRLGESEYYGNDLIKVAEQNWFISQNPILIKNMHLPPDNVYFNVQKDKMYWAQTSATSIAKKLMIIYARDNIPNLTVLDLAAGKGQQLGHFMDAGFKKGIFIDIDRVAITQLIEKRYSMMKSKYYQTKKMKTLVAVQDLNQPNEETIKNVLSLISANDPNAVKPGLIMCNLAIHYLVYDLDHLKNFGSLVSKLIEKKGYFIYNTLDGEKVFNLLKETDTWSIHEDNVLKYQIKKLYKVNKLVGFGQKIAIKLPFSGEDLYEESLVDIKVVNEYFKKIGFTIIKTGSLLDYLPEIMKISPEIYNKLHDYDRQYMDLYSYSILRFN